MKMFNTLNLSV